MVRDGPFMNKEIGILLNELIKHIIKAAIMLALMFGKTIRKNPFFGEQPHIHPASSIWLSISNMLAVIKRIT